MSDEFVALDWTIDNNVHIANVMTVETMWMIDMFVG